MKVLITNLELWLIIKWINVTKITTSVVSKVEGYAVLDSVEVGKIHTHAALMNQRSVSKNNIY